MKDNSRDFAERVKESIDIVDIISEYVELKKTGKNFKGLCPFHQENTPSFTVNPENQFYYCFGCNAGGDVFNFLMEIENITFYESLKILARKAGLAIPGQGRYGRKIDKKREHFFQLYKLSAKFYHYLLLHDNTGKKAVEYLKSRGFTEEDMDNFRLGFAPAKWDSLLNFLRTRGYKIEELVEAGLVIKSKNGSYYDRFRARIIFPIFNVRGEVLAFGGRILPDSDAPGPKYLNSPDTIIYNKGDTLYGLHLAREKLRKEDNAIIMEGYTDVLSAHKEGLTNTVASLGTALTDRQAKLLKRYVSTVYISYDGDAAGSRATMRGLDILKNTGLNVKVIDLPDDVDPDDFIRENGKDVFLSRKENAVSLIDYKIKNIIDGYDLKNPEIKIMLARKFIKLLEKVSDPIERKVYLEKIADTINIEEQLLESQLKKVAKKDKKYKNENTIDVDYSINKAENIILKVFIDNYNRRETIINKLSPDDFSKRNRELAKILWINSQQKTDDILTGIKDDKLKRRLMELRVGEINNRDYKIFHKCINKLKTDRVKRNKINIYRKLNNKNEINLIELNKLLVDFQRLVPVTEERRDIDG